MERDDRQEGQPTDPEHKSECLIGVHFFLVLSRLLRAKALVELCGPDGVGKT
jgi:hypothetical protein